MYRLAELSDTLRKRIGWTLLLMGAGLLVIAVWWIHYSSFPKTHLVDGVEVPLVLASFNWVPRGALPKAIGYLASFAASQMLLAGATFVWVLNQRMTWARAAFASFLAWVELVMIFGIVPSEWLTFAQTDLDWSAQRVALVVPPWLVLGNEVAISWAVIKDSISMGYHLVMLGAAAVFALEVQKIKKGPPARAGRRSPYGRPLVKGGA